MPEPATIIRSKRKTISIEISEKAEVIIRAPNRISAEKIKEFISNKQKWINNKLKIVKSRINSSPQKEYMPGESFLFLGKEYKLEYYKGSPGITFNGESFLVCTENPDEIKALLNEWYATASKKIIAFLAKDMASSHGLSYKSLSVNSAQKRWGSCNSEGRLNFSRRLILAPIEVIKYVVAHELAHLVHLNHSPKFWGLVKQIYPEYNGYKRWLKENGHKLNPE